MTVDAPRRRRGDGECGLRGLVRARRAIVHDRLSGAEETGADRRVRVSGRCVTWKTRPAEWRLPVKYGLYRSLDINQVNACLWCVPGEGE